MIGIDPLLLDPQQLLEVRRLAGMSEVDLDDAAKLLAISTERALPAGTTLSKRGEPLSAGWFVLEGELIVRDSARQRLAKVHEAVGFVELLAESADGLEVSCQNDAVVLEIPRASLTALIADDFEGLLGVIRAFSLEILRAEPFDQPPTRAEPPKGDPPLSFVDRLLFLHELSTFAEAGVDTVAELAWQVSEAAVSGVLHRAGSAVDRIYMVVRGALRYGTASVPAGSAFGALHVLAETPLAEDLVAEPGTSVIACDIGTVLDMLEDDLPLALMWLRGIAARLVELTAERSYP
jgi:CRP-like cAMP-binding protein